MAKQNRKRHCEFRSHPISSSRPAARHDRLADTMAEAVADSVAEPQPGCWSRAGGLRALTRTRPETRAKALLKNCEAANGLRALALSAAVSCSSIHPGPSTPTRSGSRGFPVMLGQKRWQRSGLKTLRALAESRRMPAGAHAPDRRPRPRFARSENRAAVRRASRYEHRISRAWGRSFLFRSLGLAHAQVVTDSLRAGALRESFGPGGPNHDTPVRGHLRGCPARAGAILAPRRIQPAWAASSRPQTCSLSGLANRLSAASARRQTLPVSPSASFNPTTPHKENHHVFTRS